jgi:hypothetical protein
MAASAACDYLMDSLFPLTLTAWIAFPGLPPLWRKSGAFVSLAAGFLFIEGRVRKILSPPDRDGLLRCEKIKLLPCVY